MFLISYKENATYLLLENNYMTTKDSITNIPNIKNKKTASTLSKVSWEIRNQRNELLNFNSSDEVLIYFQNLILNIEQQIDISLETFCTTTLTGKWLISNIGIGPVSATRLLSYIDINKCRTPEHLWSYAGLSPKQSDQSKSTYNSNLKEVCVDIGKNFVKYSSKENCFYGKLYLEELDRRTDLNNKGEYLELAQQSLESFNPKNKNWVKDKPVYESGKIPQQRLESQAQRYAVKIFLAHLHAVVYYETFNVEYETHHKNIIPIPNSPF